MSPNPYLFELLDGFRFPTTEEIQEVTMAVADDETRYPANIRNDYFTTDTSLSDEIEVFAEDNRLTGGMTYFHVFGTEPRQFTQKGGAAKKIKYSGVHFMEFDTIGHDEILKMASMTDRAKRQLLTERIGKAAIAFFERRQRRENMLCAEILTKGLIRVDHTNTDNPERVAYDLDYRVKNISIDVDTTEKWNHKDAGGAYTADIVDFALALNERRADADLPAPVKFVMNTKTFNEMKKNDVIYKKYWQRLLMGSQGRMEVRDIIADPRLLSDQFAAAFKTLTGISIEVRDDSIKLRDGTTTKLIPDGHVSILYKDGPIGKFTYLAHLYAISGGKPAIGTGPFSFAQAEVNVANPSYTMYSGFNAMPTLNESDYTGDFEYELLQTMKVLV